MHCCQALYDHTFDTAKANEDLQAYYDHGIKNNSRQLYNMISTLPLEGIDALDVGGGVGAITFELFKLGVRSATMVDISVQYVQLFLEEAKQQGLYNSAQGIQGDFLQCANQISPHDLLVMDKVVCCYNNYDSLVSRAGEKARRWIAYSLPADVWWVRWGHWFEQIWNRVKGDHFKTYVHPTAKIEAILLSKGFRLLEKRRWREWEYALFERKDAK